jgi:hypothetical protein
MFIAALCQLSSAGIAQNRTPYRPPAVCRESLDKPEPPHTFSPHEQSANTTATEENAIVEAGRQRRGFLSADEPANIGTLRLQLIEYAACSNASKCYWRDLQSQLDHARSELNRLVATRKPTERLAMILDIDETSLSNYCEMQREQFGFFADPFNSFLTSTEASIAIPGALELYNEAIAAHVDVYFITGRANFMYEATARNLRLAGYRNWSGLILRSKEELTMDTTYYKSTQRARIAADHRIILSVGDQWSDLNGSSQAEVSVKLPNPFYFLP